MALNVDAALITAWGVAISTVIGAVGVVIKIVLTRPRLPVAEEVLERLKHLEDVALAWAGWGHAVRVSAAASGFDLPALPMIVTMQTHPSSLPPPTAAEKEASPTP